MKNNKRFSLFTLHSSLITSAVFSIALLFTALPASLADTVVFTDGQEVTGAKVEVLRENEHGVDIKLSHGSVTVPWSRIKSITIDYPTRLAALKKDGRDSAGNLYDLMLLLLRHDMQVEAVSVSKMILSKENVSEEILISVADKMAPQKEWKTVRGAYEYVLRLNPARQDIRKRLDEVLLLTDNPAAADTIQPKVALADEPPKTAEQPKPQDQPAPLEPKTIEGMEIEEGWLIEQWGNAGEVAAIEQGTTVKNKVLSVLYRGNEKDKIAVRLGGSWDLTSHESVSLDIWNASDKSVSLTLAFNTMPGWLFYESTAKMIKPKEWTTVQFKLDTERFKSAATSWRNTGDLKNRDNVRQLILMIYNSQKDGQVYLDNIRFVQKKAKE